MDWLSKLNEPFFGTRQEAEQYMTAELKRALPDGWKIDTPSGDALSWAIEKTKLQAGEWPNQDYGVRISDNLEVVIITHSNRDEGLFAMHHALQQAMVIQASMLRKFALGECLSYVMSLCKPNEWGYT